MIFMLFILAPEFEKTILHISMDSEFDWEEMPETTITFQKEYRGRKCFRYKYKQGNRAINEKKRKILLFFF